MKIFVIRTIREKEKRKIDGRRKMEERGNGNDEIKERRKEGKKEGNTYRYCANLYM